MPLGRAPAPCAAAGLSGCDDNGIISNWHGTLWDRSDALPPAATTCAIYGPLAGAYWGAEGRRSLG
jgi:hypothetical protein